MIFAQVKNNTIENVIDLEDDSLLPLFQDGFDSLVQIDILDPQPCIGWVFDNITWVPPSPPEPPKIPDVTPRQMRQALILSGVQLSQIDDAIATLPEPQKSLTQTEWEYSLAFQRNNPLVATIAAMLGWTSDQLDALWLFAGTL